MKIPLNAASMSALVGIQAPNNLLKGLYLNQYRLLLARLQLIYQQVATESPSLVDDSGFRGAFDFLAGRSQYAQRLVLSHPSASTWSATAQALLSRRSHIRFPALHALAHFTEFSRFAAAAAIVDGVDFDTTIRLNSLGHAVLSGSGLYIKGNKTRRHSKIHIRVSNGAIETDPALCVSTIPTLDWPIEIDPFDVTHCSAASSFSFSPWRRNDRERWIDSVGQAHCLLLQATPTLAEEIPLGIRTLVPVSAHEADVHTSATFREAPGLTAISYTSDIGVMAEALVHEYHHQKLNALLATVHLTTDHGAPVFYSPWRNDKRPLIGLLHGAYSFLAVLDFWVHLFESQVPFLEERRFTQRTNLVFLQVREALESLERSAQLTTLGNALVGEMQRRLTDLSKRLPVIPAHVARRIKNVSCDHRRRYCQSRTPSESRALQAYVPAGFSDHELKCLAKLSVSPDEALRALASQTPNADPLLRRVLREPQVPIEELGISLREENCESAVISLLLAHLAYRDGDFSEAEKRYRSFGEQTGDPHGYASQCVAFCYRHLGRWSEAEALIVRTGFGRASWTVE